MRRRLTCVLLAVLLLAGLIPTMAIEASAASNMTTSEKAIAILKEFEGFAAMAYADNGQYTIGYGTRCEKDEYPAGITKAQAEILMRQHLATMEARVNTFADKYSLTFSQNQFDALILFTYNCGYSWATTDSDFRTAVIKGMTGNDFIYYMTRWCTDSINVLPGLVIRRLAEADLYLNGYYATKAPENFTYVLFNTNGGNSCDSKIQGYDASQPDAVRATPAYTGYRFLGWYTAKEGGQWITHLDAATKGITLYAHWQKDEGNVDEDGNILGDEVSYQRIAADTLPVFAVPSDDADVEDSIAKGETVTITADYVDAADVKWGQLSEGGWIQLGGTTVKTVADAKPERPEQEPEEETPSEPETPPTVEITVTSNKVNFREGPGTGYTKLGTVSSGKKLIITETADVDGVKWGKFSSGWLCLMYTNYDAVIQQGSNAEAVIATGTVVNCNSLRIRSGAGTGYSTVGSLPCGTSVKIYEKKANGSMTWGRISTGWISLSYINLVPVITEKPEEPVTPDTGADTSGSLTGTVTASSLCIRSAAGTQYKVLGTLSQGTAVTITEQTTVKGSKWGKMEKGWICLDYVKLNAASSDSTGSSGENTGSTGSGTGSGSDNPSSDATGIVTASSLCIRSAAGTQYKVLGTLSKGATVTITEQKLVNGTVWGKMEKGWICLSYVQMNGAFTGTVTSVGMVTASSLCIRSAAGTANAILGSYTKGTVVEILETTTVNGASWGRTAKGWICMDYVK